MIVYSATDSMIVYSATNSMIEYSATDSMIVYSATDSRNLWHHDQTSVSTCMESGGDRLAIPS
jgi:hypothetical protein